MRFHFTFYVRKLRLLIFAMVRDLQVLKVPTNWQEILWIAQHESFDIDLVYRILYKLEPDTKTTGFSSV